MPKSTLGQWTEKNNQFTRDLRSCLERKGKNYKNLASRAGTSESLIFKRYRHPEELSVRELRAYILEADIPEEYILNFLFLKK